MLFKNLYIIQIKGIFGTREGMTEAVAWKLNQGGKSYDKNIC